MLRKAFGPKMKNAGFEVTIIHEVHPIYECLSKSFRTGRLERELRMVELPATRCSYFSILWVSLVSFATTTLRVAFQRVFIVVYSFIDSVRKILDTPSMQVKRVFLR